MLWIFLRLKNETNGNTVKDIRYLFRFEKENDATNDRIIRDIRKLSSRKKKIIIN